MREERLRVLLVLLHNKRTYIALAGSHPLSGKYTPCRENKETKFVLKVF